MTDQHDTDILFARRGVAGLVTLNRPQALNAVTHAMVRALAQQLAEWAGDPAITRIVVTAAGGRAFSAGGDLRRLYQLRQEGRVEDALAFWRDEYRLNALIKHYRKPYVALIDGVVMGGGVGLAIHGSHRVAGDLFRFAMPEAGIGFFPDVGASWFLPRLPGERGTFCALTGAELNPAEACAAGIATHRVSSARFSELADALCGNVSVDAQLAAFAEKVEEGASDRAAEDRWAAGDRWEVVDRLCKADRVEDILAAFEAQAAGQNKKEDTDAAFARSSAARIRTKSPTSLKVTLALLRRGRLLDFDACMRTEFRVASRVARGHDFYEGIRSVIIDKDRTPRWQPDQLAAVSLAAVERYFEPLDAELDLP
ncbi:MAG TPA: enoyl-CoA hydratase/isomerase family protein [Xanthobacteraceae bacterium]|nr:enoyl-CoA hydratase/isomerase family protein [Xanthobacteraceae bacterium]